MTKRPSHEPKTFVAARVNADELRKLDELAAMWDRPRTGVIRQLLRNVNIGSVAQSAGNQPSDQLQHA